MRRVIVETPYAGATDQVVAFHERYVRACLADCLSQDEAPFASHALYTLPGVLRDDDPLERHLGIQAGLAWGQAAHATVVYTDLGISAGMRYGIQDALKYGRTVEYRSLGGAWAADYSRLRR